MDDIDAVVQVLRSDWLTTGPKVQEFEKAVADYTGVKYAVALSSGTAALHTAMFAVGIEPGDEAIVPPITFAATSNAVLYQGGKPVFCDVREDNLLIDPSHIKKLIGSRTKAIVSVDYAGHPVDYDRIRAIADEEEIFFISDACHSFGGEYKGQRVGSLADLTILSFHPVKHITSGEGGMVLTDNLEMAIRMRRFRNHGIDRSNEERRQFNTWYYEMIDLGYNYRLTDIQCALGISQLKKLPNFLIRRREVARKYDEAFSNSRDVKSLVVSPDVVHSYHLYVLRARNGTIRDRLFIGLKKEGIETNVHYIPVYLHPYYQRKLGTCPGICPIAEKAYNQILSIPMFSSITDKEVSSVVNGIRSIIAAL